MARRKQIEFQGKQGHDKGIEMATIIFCLACIVFNDHLRPGRRLTANSHHSMRLAPRRQGAARGRPLH